MTATCAASVGSTIGAASPPPVRRRRRCSRLPLGSASVGSTGEQFYNQALGVNSGKLTSSPAAGSTQMQLYVYDYTTASMVAQQIVNVNVTGAPVSAATSGYHSADTNHDWKIDDSELAAFQTLYNYRDGTTRTGEYSCTSGGYVPGPGDHSCGPNSADENSDWKISLMEFTRVIELHNAMGGYKVQAGTEDGFAPITSTASANFSPYSAAILDAIQEWYTTNQ